MAAADQSPRLHVSDTLRAEVGSMSLERQNSRVFCYSSPVQRSASPAGRFAFQERQLDRRQFLLTGVAVICASLFPREPEPVACCYIEDLPDDFDPEIHDWLAVDFDDGSRRTFNTVYDEYGRLSAIVYAKRLAVV